MSEREERPCRVRPVFGERTVQGRALFYTGIIVLTDTLLYRKGARDLRGQPLKKPVSLSAGSILVPNWNGREKPTHACFRSIYDAIRGAEHTIQNYQADRGELRLLPLSIDSGMKIIRTFLRYGRLTDEQRRELQVILSRLAVEYDRARNPRKVRARTQLGAAVKEADRLGRPNPRARLARVAGAVTNLELRLDEARAITQAVGPRKTALLLELDRLWADEWYAAWRELSEARNLLDEIVRGAEPEELSGDVGHALKQAEVAMSAIDVLPYLATREEIKGEISEARSHYLRGRHRPALQVVDRSLESIRFKRAGRALHEIVFDYSMLVTGAGEDVDQAKLKEIQGRLVEFENRLKPLSEISLKRPVKKRVLDAVDAGLALLDSRWLDRYERAKVEFTRALSYL